MGDISIVKEAKTNLEKLWKEVVNTNPPLVPTQNLTPEDISDIKDILSSKTKTYHYVLPTQLLAKYTDHNLDCRSLQASFTSEGAFDARTIAHKVIVPFDKLNYNVLGGSNESYVNNPLRYPAVTKDFRSQQKNQKDWDKIARILEKVQQLNNKENTRLFLETTLAVILNNLADAQVIYPSPSRISLSNTISLIERFSKVRSGGDTIETLVAALFITVGNYFEIFDEIKRAKINASDTSTGMSADIECWHDNQIMLGIEVKDKSLNLTQFESTIETSRANKITEILFIAEKGIQTDDAKEINKKIDQEFTSGQNIYIEDFISFVTGILILLGEKGRVRFIENVGPELDRVNSKIAVRKTWVELLKEM